MIIMVKNKKKFGVFASSKTLSTKANTLKFLQNKITKSRIEKSFDFTVSNWQKNESDIVSTIQGTFQNNIIIRSSAIGEDSYRKSEAGNYLSIQNVKISSKLKLKNNIEKVIDSYTKRDNFNLKNQILIQTYSTNISVSGVVFTKTPDIGSPYYVINFEEGPSTYGVTHGQAGNTTKIFKKIKTTLIPKKWRKLLDSIIEIEKILKSDLLDIEFGITKNKEIIIFQVRPITSIQEASPKKLDGKISKLIQKNKEEFEKLNKLKRIPETFTIFSDMSDWNPAEIIGNNPNYLDYSLYDYLVMGNAWRQGRKIMGYQDVKTSSLMRKFANKPYVDVRASFNSLIPESIPKHLKNKLMKFYLQKLSKNPHLHDKVEFEILFTCYDLTLETRLQELVEYGFSKNKISKIKEQLLNFTNKIIEDFSETCLKCDDVIKKMKQINSEVKQELSYSEKNHKILLISAERLLMSCKNLGTVQFSTIARIAFIGTIIMKSLQKQGHVKSKVIEDFMNSITTSVSELQNDFEMYVNNKFTKKQFLEKYGHLRSGTYDITALRYDQANQFFDKIKYVKRNSGKIKNSQKLKTPKILLENNLKFRKMNFWDFVRESLFQRERLKFEFTKNLSDALELIAKAGKNLGFSRNEISNLEITTLLRLKNKPKFILKQILREKIVKNTEQKSLNNYLVLPPLIFSKKDFEIVEYMITKPNYISTKMITGEIIILQNLQERIPTLSNKIIIIENADPGYDWLFTKNPLGLITKYGGVASHMAIRCAELGLPAAIGCGEFLFEKLLAANKILLDCKNEQIIFLESENPDEFIEQKRILKSLGYIK